MAYKYNGKFIRAGRSWQDDNNITHPATWMRWSDDYKVTMGLVWEDAPASEAPFDNRFYWGRQADGTLIERSLTDVAAVDEDGNAINDPATGQQMVTLGLKSVAIAKTKETANAKLAKTDWMIVKAAEVSSYTVPSDVLTYRAAVRTASNNIETAVTNAADHAAFRALHDYTEDDDGNQVVAPIADWPDEI
jgi:hypothetical protein